MPAILTHKTCGTCEYRTGDRALCQGGRSVQCASSGDKGACGHKTMSKSIKHQANRPGCPKYIPWSKWG